MRIIEVIIDGFKSYAVRTVISGWDESFNSITGLNGSGKSNILDSICFVLGITNMSTVRAQNLQDLIYKRGQAGVTKASVTIVFDNRDKKKSPIGFEEYATISVTRQIVLGGTSKYLINGHRAQQQTVQNLFQITKVLNMKAVEILAMIEEAAGTRMFEDRRDKALKTMAKKELKLQELSELLRDEIEPKLDKLRTEKRACQEKLKQSAADLEAKKRRQKYIGKVRLQRDQEMRKGGKARALEDMTSSLTEEREIKTSTEKSVAELETALKEKTTAFENAKSAYDVAKEHLAKETKEAESKEELLQTLQTGVASRDGLENGYQGQLQDARQRTTAAATEQEQSKLKIAHLQSRLKEEEPRASKAKEQNAGRESALLQHVRDLRQNADQLRRRVANIDFNYTDPVPGFDRSKVKGLVAQLFTLDEKHTSAGTALEICAGGRLYNVVVDTEVTGTQLLQKGKLRKRVTIIPLNKITTFKASAQVIATAKNIAPGKVNLALTLVGFDDEVIAAMETRSITLEGDAYDPSGTLSGGSSPNSSGVLVTLQKLNNMTTSEKNKLDEARRIKQDLDLKSHEIKLAEEQISGNSSSSIIQEVEKMKATIVELEASIVQAKERHAEASADARRIEKDMKDFDTNKDAKLVELQKSLDRLRGSLSENSGAVKRLQKELQAAQLDLEQVGGDLSTAREQLQEVHIGIQAQEQDVEDLAKQQTGAAETHDTVQAELDDERAKLHLFDDELGALEEAVRSKNARIAEEGLEIQKLGHQIERFHKEQQGAADNVTRLESEHDWIHDEKDKFGRSGTPYDFEGQNIGECKATLRNLTERFQGMKKKINPKVMNMIDSVEKKEALLKNMIKTVIRDKRKIEETIVSLDDYKKKALQETWQKVNGDFGHIFSELLPGGSFAKLDPPEGKTISDGLEVKVCLGKVWKQSLTELSGGQRSLVALSLIMALLQFKPAPMYILDEVDAALDLSHTQNIGRLIKTRFKGSQFIVVSLKDGMFQNANRIFRTRFSEGTSMVQALTPADLK
ncbi:hypothetical protein CDD81_2749 [Ophiocordyceps australis]|uniref:SMC hinge domain-containing protein n=1 Tax=Ophiocordyceps australis TaxID=1399860 RepID=A0A2C5Y9E7_9HYPO|nr:hypothetical protein CDD81_2749 [Ophiocordyceps australis]